MEKTITAGSELDAQIAAKVMGWHHEEGERPSHYWHGPDGYQADLPSYSTDIGAAWLILPKFADFRIESENEVSGQYCVRLDVRRPNGSTYPVRESVWRFEDIPIAICRAALIAQAIRGALPYPAIANRSVPWQV